MELARIMLFFLKNQSYRFTLPLFVSYPPFCTV